ncbi:MAG: hypothetical protein NWF11_02590 [Candidatus Bathyarchaeota archaeon]|nr:hypothetical protein [Candidatus Bathyarchaeota archaeon]
MQSRYVNVVVLFLVLLAGLQFVFPAFGSLHRKWAPEGYRRNSDVVLNRQTQGFDDSPTGNVTFYAPLIVVVAIVGVLGFFGIRDARKKDT